MKRKYKYLYGPVYSWRLGRSLGVDMIAQYPKWCDYDCVYCQLGSSRARTTRRRVFVSTKAIMEEIASLPKNIPVDYITISGMGEPTLASNIGTVIRRIKAVRREKVAVLTNATLLGNALVRRELAAADLVDVKLDAVSRGSLHRINRPMHKVASFKRLLNGIKKFRRLFKGKLSLQIMLVNENRYRVPMLVQLAKEIRPDVVHLNTPLRPSAVKPVTPAEMREIKAAFRKVPAVSVYERRKKAVRPFSGTDTARRRKWKV